MGTEAFQELYHFISKRMRIGHIYQPVMLKVLLENGGTASQKEIASAFLSEDRSQIEYYETVVRRLPGRVLHNHGIIEKVTAGYRLADPFFNLSEQERIALIKLCEARLATYLEKRGPDSWPNQANAEGYIPGGLRYDVIRRAKKRCEACGISADKRALEVSHIVPRNRGGTDDSANLQALCHVCNAHKRDRDDLDFAAVQATYDDRQEGCPFCDVPTDCVIVSNTLALAIRDLHPVTEGHTLIIPKRHVADYFDLYQPERNAVEALLSGCREALTTDDRTIEGFNIGVNVGVTAGQAIPHVHVHLIPRRKSG